jgi:hypothetical protein
MRTIGFGVVAGLVASGISAAPAAAVPPASGTFSVLATPARQLGVICTRIP